MSRPEIHPPIAERWSPRAFADRPIAAADLASLFEAARWAASCFNEQPWRFLVCRRDEEPEGWARLLDCLVEANAAWARSAPVLMLTVARLSFTRNDRPNRHAYHDVGLAMGNLSIQAQTLGISLHQMGGFDLDRASEEFAIPAGFDPVAAVALGYAADPATLPEELRARETAPRTRRPLEELAFGPDWGRTFAALG